AEIHIAEKAIRRLNPGKEFFTAGSFVWFEDGSGFLFAARESQNSPSQIWRAAYPSLELHQITNDFNDYYDCSISADGVSLVTSKGETSASIWKFSPTTKTLEQLMPDSRDMEGFNGMSETPDCRIVFTRNDGKEADIYIAESDAKNPKALTSEPG